MTAAVGNITGLAANCADAEPEFRIEGHLLGNLQPLLFSGEPLAAPFFCILKMAMPRARTFSFSSAGSARLRVAVLLHSHWTHAPWTRLSPDPIISPQGDGWESAGTFNPAVVLHRGKFVMLYRAQDKDGTSRLGYAESSDGIHFSRRPAACALSRGRTMKKTAASKIRAW